MASARVQDPEFDKTVGAINTYMNDYRRTYKDREYLRDPAATPLEASIRRDNDKKRAMFEAQK